MARKTNEAFFAVGAACLSVIFLTSWHSQPLLEAVEPWLAFPTIISLLSFGVLPRVVTGSYLRGDYWHGSLVAYLDNYSLLRWMFIITDHPNVVAKRRGARA